jgi:type IV secretion system protein VirB10
MLGQDGKPFKAPDGTPMRVCKDGHVAVPALQPSQTGAQPIAVTGNPQVRQGQTQRASRYTGDVMVASQSSSTVANGARSQKESVTAAAMATLNNLTGQNRQTLNSFANTPANTLDSSGGSSSPPGSIGNQLKPSQTPRVTASMLGDRNMILPKGRTIDCGLSLKLVNEVAGMASCVVSQNVYSDNGRIVLLERGSEATGEYGAAMAQGQRRLFVLWTRIKTPEGVVVELNSPAADGMGTSGLGGYVDNHWWDRLGAAFMLSLVQDAISYETATGSGSSGGSSNLAVFQNTTQTGNKMAEKVLESTINIKPTLYRNQGARGTIFVARDLDFGSVYALQAR